MKRLLYAAALVAVIGLIGCGSKVDDKETSVVNSTAAQTQSTTKKEEAQSSTSAQKTA